MKTEINIYVAIKMFGVLYCNSFSEEDTNEYDLSIFRFKLMKNVNIFPLKHKEKIIFEKNIYVHTSTTRN